MSAEFPPGLERSHSLDSIHQHPPQQKLERSHSVPALDPDNRTHGIGLRQLPNVPAQIVNQNPIDPARVSTTFGQKVKAAMTSVAKWIVTSRLFSPSKKTIQFSKGIAERELTSYLRPPGGKKNFKIEKGRDGVSRLNPIPRYPAQLSPASKKELTTLFYQSPDEFADAVGKFCHNEKELDRILQQIPDKFPYSKADMEEQVKNQLADINPKALSKQVCEAIFNGPTTPLQQKLLNHASLHKIFAGPQTGDPSGNFIKMCQDEGFSLQQINKKLSEIGLSSKLRTAGADINKILGLINAQPSIQKILSRNTPIERRKELAVKMKTSDITSSKGEDLYKLSKEHPAIYDQLLKKLTKAQKKDVQQKAIKHQVPTSLQTLTNNQTILGINQAFDPITDEAIPSFCEAIFKDPTLKAICENRENIAHINKRYPKIYKELLARMDEPTKQLVEDHILQIESNETGQIRNNINTDITLKLSNLSEGTQLTGQLTRGLTRILSNEKSANVFLEEVENTPALFKAVDKHYTELVKFSSQITNAATQDKFRAILSKMPTQFAAKILAKEDAEAATEYGNKDLKPLFKASKDDLIILRETMPHTFALFEGQLTDQQRLEVEDRLLPPPPPPPASAGLKGKNRENRTAIMGVRALPPMIYAQTTTHIKM